MWNRIRALVWKELLQLRRDKLTLVMILFIPLFQITIYGFLNNDVKHLHTIVLDESRSQESRDFVQAMAATQYFDVQGEVGSEADIRRLIDAGQLAKLPLSDFVEQVWAQVRSTENNPSTWERESRGPWKAILPALGHVRMEQLDAARVPACRPARHGASAIPASPGGRADTRRPRNAAARPCLGTTTSDAACRRGH